jgi:hypothetical protein
VVAKREKFTGIGDWGLGNGDWVMGTGDWGLGNSGPPLGIRGNGDWVMGIGLGNFITASSFSTYANNYGYTTLRGKHSYACQGFTVIKLDSYKLVQLNTNKYKNYSSQFKACLGAATSLNHNKLRLEYLQ